MCLLFCMLRWILRKSVKKHLFLCFRKILIQGYLSRQNAWLPQFFFADSNSPCKDLLFPRCPKLAHNSLYLLTIRLKGTLHCIVKYCWVCCQKKRAEIPRLLNMFCSCIALAYVSHKQKQRVTQDVDSVTRSHFKNTGQMKQLEDTRCHKSISLFQPF